MKCFLCLMVVLITNFSWAQTTKTVDTEAAMQSTVMAQQVANLIAEINNVSKNGSSEPLMRLFNRSYRNRVTIFDLDNKTRIENRDFVTTQLFYNRYTQPNVRADYHLTKIIKSYSTDSIGFVMFELDYDMYNAGKLYKVGEQTLTMQLVKNGNQWLFEDGITVIKYKQLNKTTCDCQLYNKGTDYVATIQAPKGDDYVTKYHTIRFATANATQKEVYVDGALYLWTTEGKSYITTPDKRTLTAKTQNEAEIINLILSDLYKENCFSVNFQK
jgi:hypothetical protein